MLESTIESGKYSGADNIADGARLKEYYRQAERYGTGSIKELENGRYRFYEELKPAKTQGKMTREELCEWSMSFIRNDSEISIMDIEAWRFLVALSNIDEMIAPNEYLFSEADIRGIIHQYKN